jgi:ferritin-like metal-binding protein YciE
MRGLLAEKEVFLETEPSEDLVDVFNVENAIKAECYEIRAYESLIEMARAMKYQAVGRILAQIMREEKLALRKMERFAARVKPRKWTIQDLHKKDSGAWKAEQRQQPCSVRFTSLRLQTARK